MREINECTAEVFRRSEKRIKERRKKRNRILALGIPLCLIVTVFSAIILPEMMPSAMKKDDVAEMVVGADSNASADEMVENAAQSLVCSYTAVEIRNVDLFPEHYEKVTDKVAVTVIFNAIHSLFTDVDVADRNSGENYQAPEDNAYSDKTETASISKGYTIIFTTEKGSQTVYNLSENTLLNVNTNETVVLSDAQVAELTAVFGILD